MGDGLVHRQPLGQLGLVGDDQVDVVGAAQAVVHRADQRVGVRRQVDAHELRLEVEDAVDEARILVREAVVLLAPERRGLQVVQRGDRQAPGELARHLQELGELVHHARHDGEERLVGGEEAVAPGEQVALEPGLAGVLAEHLQHAPVVGADVAAVARHNGPLVVAVGRLEDGAELVRLQLVGREDAELMPVARDDVAQVERPPDPGCRPCWRRASWRRRGEGTGTA